METAKRAQLQALCKRLQQNHEDSQVLLDQLSNDSNLGFGGAEPFQALLQQYRLHEKTGKPLLDQLVYATIHQYSVSSFSAKDTTILKKSLARAQKHSIPQIWHAHRNRPARKGNPIADILTSHTVIDLTNDSSEQHQERNFIETLDLTGDVESTFGVGRDGCTRNIPMANHTAHEFRNNSTSNTVPTLQHARLPSTGLPEPTTRLPDGRSNPSPTKRAALRKQHRTEHSAESIETILHKRGIKMQRRGPQTTYASNRKRRACTKATDIGVKVSLMMEGMTLEERQQFYDDVGERKVHFG